MNAIIKLVLLSLFTLTSTQLLYAQDVGRLPDGRAYRTDAQGYQLVDYIAELELKIEELQNKLISKDNDQRVKNSNGDIEEADLLSNSSESTSNNPVVNCDLEIQSSNSELKSELAALQSKNDSLLRRIENQEANSEANNVASDNVAKINDLEFALQQSESKLEEQKQQLATLTRNVSSRDSEIASLQSKLAGRSNSQTVRASQPYATTYSRGSTGSSKRESAFEHLKQQLTRDLQEADSLFAQRRELESQYSRSNSQKSSQVKLSPMKTKDGSTLNTLRQSLSKAVKFSQLGKVQKNIYVMRRALKADVAILKRLNN